MAGTGPGDLHALAVEYLDAVDAALATTDAGPILRKFVSHGPPPWDCCPMLAVHVGGPSVAETGIPAGTLASGVRIAGGMEVDLVALTATVIRCGPAWPSEGEDFPTTEANTAAAAATNADLWATWSYVKTKIREKSLFAGESRPVVLDPAVSFNQQGGCVGWLIPIRVQLDGYRA